MTPICGALAGVVLILAGGLAPQATADKAKLAQLKRQADAVLKLPNNSAREKVDAVFEYAELAAQSGLTDDAMKYYDAGLRIYALDYDSQMAYAELLAKAGKDEQAKRRAGIVAKSAEDDALVVRARKLLGQDAPADFPPLAKPEGTGPVVVIVPLEDVDRLLLGEIQQAVKKAIGIEVLIRKAQVKMPPARKSPMADFAAKLRQSLAKIRKTSPRLVVEAMRKTGLTEDELEDNPDNVIRVFRALLARGNDQESLRNFDANVANMDQDDQWSMEELCDLLKTAVAPCRRPMARFLGITRRDMFSKDYGFLFGGTDGECGTASYRRFMAESTHETPDRSRLLKREVRQCLSSIGFMFGVERCSDPTCPRAYPNSVAEQDKKGDELCPDCRKGFDEAFGRAKAPAASGPATAPK